jgi:cyclophilin family peptidyl-prolyl cis-trans isomerase
MQFLPVSSTRYRRGVSILAALMAASPLAVLSAPPTIDEPVPVNPESFPTHVEPRVPVGKALIFPITASDPEGGALKYTVNSDNPKITVSVRTALPKLKILVDHAGDTTEADPAFSGELEIALLRDLAPTTVANISGFAQGHYYNYDGAALPNFGNQIFHRIANLDPTEQPDGSFIIQGGDPKGTGSGGPGFTFNDEFHPSALFFGRGQLAMANAGISGFDFRGTNGSQFFITLGQPRFLDFNHTIFGQLLRGWDLMETIADVPRSQSDKPLVDVKLTTTTVEPNFTDAVLLISATAVGTGKITVKVTDPDGEEATKEFDVTAYKDTRNSPPFIRPVPNQTVDKEKVLGIPLSFVDLEHDFAFFNHRILFSNNARSSGGGSTAFVLGNPGFAGQINMGIGITEFDMTYRGSIDGAAASDADKTGIAVAIGDKRVTATARDIGGTPGVEITNAIIAGYLDGDPTALPTDFTAKVIWGDGTYHVPPTDLTGGDAKFPATIARDTSSPFPGAFVVTATHTYQHPGIYPMTVELSATKGQRVTLRGTAVISTSGVRAFGKSLEINGATLTNGVLATFTDVAPGPLSGYTARMHWGDGQYSPGVVSRALNGELQILGTHTFPSEGEYAVVVELTKFGDPNPPAMAWSRVEVTGVKAPPVLPPYDLAHLVGQMGDATNIGNGLSLVKTGNQTAVAVQLIVVNAGTKASRAGKLRFFLSEDKVVNLVDESEPVFNPKDLPVKIGNLKEVKLQALPPGSGVRFVFNRNSQGDFRLKFPPNEGGQGLNLLAHFEYSDPIGDHMPIPHDVVVGPFNPFIVKPTLLTVRESGGPELSKKFTVALAKQPRANVTIDITLSATAAAEITVAPTSLTFTPENWNTPQEVTVTAKEDNNANDTKNVTVALNPATSTDPRYNNQDPADVTVTVQDKQATP